MPPVYSTELRNEHAKAKTTIIGNAGKLKIYTSADVLLITFTLASPPAPTPSGGIWTASTIASAVAVAAGSAAKATVTKSTDVVVISALTVTGLGGGGDVELDTVSVVIAIGDNIAVDSFTITSGNP